AVASFFSTKPATLTSGISVSTRACRRPRYPVPTTPILVMPAVEQASACSPPGQAEACPTLGSSDESSFGPAHELHQRPRLGYRAELGLDLLQRVVELQMRADQDAIGALQRLDRILGHTFALQADGVDAERLVVARADGLGVRQHVLRAHRAAADE